MAQRQRSGKDRTADTERAIELARNDPPAAAQILFWKGVEQLERAADETGPDAVVALMQLGNALIAAADKCVALYERIGLPTSPPTSN